MCELNGELQNSEKDPQPPTLTRQVYLCQISGDFWPFQADASEVVLDDLTVFVIDVHLTVHLGR